MWSALRGGALSSSHYAVTHQWKNLASSYSILTRHFSSVGSSDNSVIEKNDELLSLAEVEKILNDVGADDVKVIKTPERCEFTDYMVIATGRSPWHVRNISQALIYQARFVVFNRAYCVLKLVFVLIEVMLLHGKDLYTFVLAVRWWKLHFD